MDSILALKATPSRRWKALGVLRSWLQCSGWSLPQPNAPLLPGGTKAGAVSWRPSPLSSPSKRFQREMATRVPFILRAISLTHPPKSRPPHSLEHRQGLVDSMNEGPTGQQMPTSFKGSCQASPANPSNARGCQVNLRLNHVLKIEASPLALLMMHCRPNHFHKRNPCMHHSLY